MAQYHLCRFRSNGRILLLCVCGFILAAAATSFLSSRPREAAPVQPLEAGYDFSAASDESNPGSGPKLGERIDLSLFKGPGGATLGEAMRGRAAVVALVDDECDMVRDAADQMMGIREDLAWQGVAYYLVSLDPHRDRERFFRYAETLRLHTASFLWAEGEKVRPSSFWMMVRPSHLLLDGDGTVLLKWPGTSADPQIRRRMRRQIVADTLLHQNVTPR